MIETPVHAPLLSLITFLPLLAAFALLLLPGTIESTRNTSRWIALWTSIVVFAISVTLWARFDPTLHGFQFQERASWLPEFGISYHLGLDGISLLFVMLTTALTPIAILGSWRLEVRRPRDYMLAILVLETTLLGLFSSLDFLLFYMFFEATLIPASLLIGNGGGPKQVRAAFKFFLYSLGGSLFMLIALLVMWRTAGTTDIPVLLGTHFGPVAQMWMFVAFTLAFGVKLPIFPLHSWMADAYTEAPAPACVLISGVLSKAGAYGFLRFAIYMLPDAAHRASPLMIGLGIVAAIYGALLALAQTDMKRLIAYSSYSHMGMILIGLFSLNAIGFDGAVFEMLSQGIVIAALFLIVGALAARTGSREIGGFGGVARRMPTLAGLAMLFTMANIGLPGTSAFVGELLVLVGVFQIGFWVAVLSGLGMILAAIYMLVLYRRLMFGTVSNMASALRDLTATEVAVLVPLVAITLWMGIYPSSFSHVFDQRMQLLAQTFETSYPVVKQAKVSVPQVAEADGDQHRT
ncbi:MAG TPA: NADH-quinone oxidoreductase subunit M [Acetobacteraceae bacterium]|jgi:NADH-quinone oxidoreductase subunit M